MRMNPCSRTSERPLNHRHRRSLPAPLAARLNWNNMLTQTIADAMNAHINAEMYSAYLYLSMAAYLESENFPGMARWTKLQAQEEAGHAMKFFGHMTERGGRVLLQPIATPPASWESPAAVFEAIYTHECHVTGLIHSLYEKALAERDYASTVFLEEFIKEQVEEEATASAALNRLRMTEGSRQALLIMDRALGERRAG